MNHSLDSSTEQLVEEFNQHLKKMTEYHQQACARGLFHRLQEDLHGMSRPPEPRKPLLAQAGTWLVRQIVFQLEQLDRVQEIPGEDAVVVIDAPYTVIAPDTPSATKRVRRMEMTPWAK